MSDLIVAIDAGTQSVRAALVDLTGEIHKLVKNPIEPYFSELPGYAEQDPDYYWERLCATTRELLADVPHDRLLAATVTTQRVTMINVDAQGRPLRPAIVWLDQRKADIGKVLPSLTFPVLKAARLYPLIEYATQYSRSNWIQQNQPEIWEATHKFLYLSGYFTYRLTGEFTDSTGNIVGTIPFDVKKMDWCGSLDPKWRMFPMEREKLPALVQPGERLGAITPEAAEQTGLPAGLPFVASSNDKACDIIGAGCLTPEVACVSFGTTATINTQTSKYVELRPMLPPYPSAVPREFYTEVAVMRGLWMVSWFKDEFGLQERLRAADSGEAPEELLEELVRRPGGCPGPGVSALLDPGPRPGPVRQGGGLRLRRRTHPGAPVPGDPGGHRIRPQGRRDPDPAQDRRADHDGPGHGWGVPQRLDHADDRRHLRPPDLPPAHPGDLGGGGGNRRCGRDGRVLRCRRCGG